jgi:hypothetical protein
MTFDVVYHPSHNNFSVQGVSGMLRVTLNAACSERNLRRLRRQIDEALAEKAAQATAKPR